MEEIKVKIKRWGNSFAVIIPKRISDKHNLKEDGEIIFAIKPYKTITAGEIMDIAKRHPIKLKKSVEHIMREMDYELYGIRR